MITDRVKSMRTIVIVSGCLLGIAAIVYRQASLDSARRNSDNQKIVCKVIGPDGAPVTGATVTAVALLPDQRSRTAVTDANGECRFDADNDLPRATLDGQQIGTVISAQSPTTAPAFGVAAWSAAASHSTTTLHLGKPDSVLLKVRDGLSAPLPNLAVRLAAVRIGSVYVPIGITGPGSQGGRTDPHGEVRLERLPHGDRVIISTDDKAFVPATPSDSIALDGVGEYHKTIRLHAAGQISGRLVYVSDGRPEPGVTVVADCLDERHPHTATSDTNGMYTFSRLLPGHYNVTADIRHRGWYVNPAACNVSAGKTSHTQLTAQRMSLLTIKVKDQGGLPVPGVMVDNVTTNAIGLAQVYVKPGRHMVAVGMSIIEPVSVRKPSSELDGISAAGGYPGAGSGHDDKLLAMRPFMAPVMVRSGASAKVMLIVDVPASQNIQGLVTDANGTPVAGAFVHSAPLAAYQNGIRISDEWGRFDADSGVETNGQCPSVAVTDRDGRFRVSRVSTIATLWASQGSTNSSPSPIRVRPGQHYILELHKSVLGAIIGKVVTKAGQPVSKAKVHIRRHYEHSSPFESGPLAVTDEAGRFVIDSLPCGLRYSLHICSKSQGSVDVPGKNETRITLNPGEVRVLPTIVAPDALRTVEGVVKDQTGHPVAHATVIGSGLITGIRRAVTDNRGHFSISHVAAEAIRIRATIDAPLIRHPDAALYAVRSGKPHMAGIQANARPVRSAMHAPLRTIKPTFDGGDGANRNTTIAQIKNGMIVNNNDPPNSGQRAAQPDFVTAQAGTSNVEVPLSPA